MGRSAALRERASLRTEALSGPLRDEPPYSRTSFLTLTGRVPHGPEALTGRALTEALTGRASLRGGGAYGPLYGTAPYRATPAGSEGVTGPANRFYGTTHYGTKLLPYRPEALTKRASLRAGGAYGTSHGPAALTGLASLHNGGTDGTSLLTGRRLTGRARLRDGGP